MPLEAWTWRNFLAGVCALLCAGLAAAQVPEAGARVGPNPRAPWLREGLVFTSNWYAMSHAGHATDFKQDDQGNWMGTDGTRLEAMGRPSTSAGGVSQTVVTCIDGNKIFLESRTFTDMRVLGFPDPVPQGKPTTFVVGIAGCDLWMEPGKLALMHSDPATNTIVQPVQWPSDGKTIDAVRMTTMATGHYLDHVYDRATGICIHAAESSTGGAGQLKYLAPGESAEGDTQFGGFNLMRLRDVNTPWAGEAAPTWAAQFKTLHYSGITQPDNRFLAAPTRLVLDVSRLDSGNGWLSTTMSGSVISRTGQSEFPSRSIYLSGRDQYDGFFAGTNALANLQTGQLLDSDPVTHIQITVASADASSVTIVSSNGSVQVSRTFDRQTGKLLAFSNYSRMTRTRISFQLQGEE